LKTNANIGWSAVSLVPTIPGVSQEHADKAVRAPARFRISAAALLVVMLALPSVSPGAEAPAQTRAPEVTVIERGLNYRVVQTPGGGQYTELGTGMHFFRGDDLLESKEEIL